MYGATDYHVYQLKQNTNGDWMVKPIVALTGVRSIIGTAHALYAVVAGYNGSLDELAPPTKGQTGWTTTVIHTFTGDLDAAYPGAITFDNSGNIVGQSSAGGGSANCGSDNGVPTGCGTVFKFSESGATWTETILHVWPGGAKGALPFAGPSFDAAGDIYAATQQGGGTAASHPPAGCFGGGVQAVATPSGTGYGPFSEMFKENCKSAKNPQYPVDVILPITLPAPSATATAANGAIINSEGGGNSTLCADLDNGGCGTVGLLTAGSDRAKPWKYTALHNFSSTDGSLPYGAMLPVGASTIYGVTDFGGLDCKQQTTIGCGTIYQLTLKNGRWVWGGVVHKFNGTNGAFPTGALIDYNGMILGTTGSGGRDGGGTVFELVP